MKKEYWFYSIIIWFKPKTLRLLPVLLIGSLWLSGCSLPAGSTDPGDKWAGYQTRILQVKVQPDTVAVGDTARITCFIQDSTDKRFKYYWRFSYGKVLNAQYDSVYEGYVSGHRNYVFWIAPDSPGLYWGNGVEVDNSSDSIPPTIGFALHVKK